MEPNLTPVVLNQWYSYVRFMSLPCLHFFEQIWRKRGARRGGWMEFSFHWIATLAILCRHPLWSRRSIDPTPVRAHAPPAHTTRFTHSTTRGKYCHTPLSCASAVIFLRGCVNSHVIVFAMEIQPGWLPESRSTTWNKDFCFLSEKMYRVSVWCPTYKVQMPCQLSSRQVLLN